MLFFKKLKLKTKNRINNDNSPKGAFQCHVKNPPLSQLRIPTGSRQTSWLFTKRAGKNRKARSNLNTTTTKSAEIKVCRQVCFGLDRTKYLVCLFNSVSARLHPLSVPYFHN